MEETNMETRAIGSLKVSVVGLGCNNFGMRCDETQSTAVVHEALDAGITFFDTADVYGGTLSEQFLGRALAGRRDEVIVATKFGMPLGGEGEAGASAAWIERAAEGSLRRLGIDCIDLYQQHAPDDSVPIEETLEALDRLVTAGKVRQIGHSNFSADQIDVAAATAEEHASARFVSAQNQFSLLRTGVQRDVLPACVRHDVALLPYFPLASGLLTGKYRRDSPVPAGTRLAGLPDDRAAQILSERNFDLVDQLDAYAIDRGHTILELAFAWLAAQPNLASVIAGATTPEQVRSNSTAANWVLSTDELAAVDQLLADHRAQHH
jgi:aryl-alcohol dehydrogenase-like predicted oxidoreductase